MIRKLLEFLGGYLCNKKLNKVPVTKIIRNSDDQGKLLTEAHQDFCQRFVNNPKAFNFLLAKIEKEISNGVKRSKVLQKYFWH